MRYGFVIDQDRCIGCHACTVACKEEHQVPIGVFRTWVKYIEKGEFPHTSRHFGVMRCNHCDSAPCTEICPTHALYRRSDGIIDFDNRRCIGCKACMQACPYDALYIDPNTNTAAKCNFCAHRVENNLEPACVIVCPTQAIIAGDLDNPASKVSRIVATQKVSVRKPQKGTESKLYYVGIEGDLLEPTRLSRQNTYAFADAGSPPSAAVALDGVREQRDHGAKESSFDPAVTREVYDVAHPAPWGWKIAAYLWTKSIAAGVMLVAGQAATVLHFVNTSFNSNVVLPIISLAALALTMLLLVLDLKRPDRFFYLLTKSNFRSWLVLGGYILMAYGAATTMWLVQALSGQEVNSFLIPITMILALASAGYSAFLFAQAKGRELWHSSLFFFHLLVQAMVAGTATLVITSVWSDVWILGEISARILRTWMILNLLMVLMEIFLPRGNKDAHLAIKALIRGKWKIRFWVWTFGLCMLLPFIVLPFSPVIGSALALAGLWLWDDLWVRVGQSLPLS
jgi:Fe-S-cluster-containing dehydrogenase component/formate-dependent nitrite reductase membrane component NrfD